MERFEYLYFQQQSQGNKYARCYKRAYGVLLPWILMEQRSETGDATDPATNRKIEFKATSRFEGDLSSFGPKCTFDDLVFLRFNLEENLLYIYDLKINSEEFGRYPAETFELNFNIKVDCRDIHNVQPEEIPDLDVLLAGFPCQAYAEKIVIPKFKLQCS